MDFNIKGRKWDSPKGVAYFTNLEAWRIAKAQGASAGGAAPAGGAPEEPFFDEEDGDGLPF